MRELPFRRLRKPLPHPPGLRVPVAHDGNGPNRPWAIRHTTCAPRFSEAGSRRGSLSLYLFSIWQGRRAPCAIRHTTCAPRFSEAGSRRGSLSLYLFFYMAGAEGRACQWQAPSTGRAGPGSRRGSLSLYLFSIWQGRRDSNPQSWFWRPVVYQLTDAPLIHKEPHKTNNANPNYSSRPHR